MDPGCNVYGRDTLKGDQKRAEIYQCQNKYDGKSSRKIISPMTEKRTNGIYRKIYKMDGKQTTVSLLIFWRALKGKAPNRTNWWGERETCLIR